MNVRRGGVVVAVALALLVVGVAVGTRLGGTEVPRGATVIIIPPRAELAATPTPTALPARATATPRPTPTPRPDHLPQGLQTWYRTTGVARLIHIERHGGQVVLHVSGDVGEAAIEGALHERWPALGTTVYTGTLHGQTITARSAPSLIGEAFELTLQAGPSGTASWHVALLSVEGHRTRRIGTLADDTARCGYQTSGWPYTTCHDLAPHPFPHPPRGAVITVPCSGR